MKTRPATRPISTKIDPLAMAVRDEFERLECNEYRNTISRQVLQEVSSVWVKCMSEVFLKRELMKRTRGGLERSEEMEL